MAKTEFIWDVVTDNVMMEKDGAGATQAVYTQEPSQYGRLISQRRGSQTSYYHFDGNGNTRALTDSGQNITDTYVNTAFGDQVATTGTTPNRYRFGGQVGYQYNEKTADYYVRARVYEPKRGRWGSKDPMRFVDGMNLYAYVGASPPNAIDASGFGWFSWWIEAASALAVCSLKCRESAKTMRDVGQLFMSPKDGSTVFHESRKPNQWKKTNFPKANGISVGVHFKQSDESEKNKWCCCDDGFKFIQLFSSNMRSTKELKPVHIDGAKGTRVPYYEAQGKKIAGRLPPTLGLKYEMYDSPYVIAADFPQSSNPKPGKVHTVTAHIATCVVCNRKKPRKDAILGCIHWGFAYDATRLLDEKRKPQLEGRVRPLVRWCSGPPDVKSPIRKQLEKQFSDYFKNRLAGPDDVAPKCC